jgi:hypothetical protein
MQKTVKGRLETTTKELRALCDDIEGGEMKVPQFQRKFVWKEEQALDLLDSIASNYPIGSLLLWKTKVKMRVERNIGDFQLPVTDDLEPTDYVLDGQQRLTVIYSCLGAKEGVPGFAAAYDLEKEEFVTLPDSSPVHVFPLRRMQDMTKVLDFRAALLVHPQGKILHDRFDALLATLTSYKVPVVTLKDLTVEEVCPIFERINSSGTPLSTYDLMVAATWTENFDLNEQTSKIQAALKPKGFDDIEGGTILKCLSAIHFKGIKREQVLDLRKLKPDEMDALVEDTKKSLLKTVDLLVTEFRVYSWDFLPYEALAIVLSYVYSKTPKLTPDHITRVRQWFWRSAFSERYRGASEHFVSSDLERIHDFVVNQKGNPDLFGSLPSSDIWKTVAFRSNNSRSRAFVLALALKKPRNLTNGTSIDVSEALSIYNQKEFHHIYPRAYLKALKAPGEHNAIANFCMLAASENKVISDQDPHTYLPNCIAQLDGDAETVFASNLLPSPKTFDYTKADYPTFQLTRAPMIGQLVTDLCNGKAL